MPSTQDPASPAALLRKLASRTSHDLNNLIAILSGHLYLLDRPEGSSAESLDAMRKAVEELEKLSRNLGTLGALGAGDPEPVSLNEVARRAAGGPKLSTVTLELAESLPRIRGSPADLTTAVGCLLANAVEASGPGSAVLLTTEQDPSDGGLVLSVSDSGHGVAPEIEARIFDPFSSTKGGRGTGIGLFLVAAVAAAHGATCRVGPRPGGGTRAELRFPAPAER